MENYFRLMRPSGHCVRRLAKAADIPSSDIDRATRAGLDDAHHPEQGVR